MPKFVIRATNRPMNRCCVEWAGALYGWIAPAVDPKLFDTHEEAQAERVRYEIVSPLELGIPGDQIEEVRIVEVEPHALAMSLSKVSAKGIEVTEVAPDDDSRVAFWDEWFAAGGRDPLAIAPTYPMPDSLSAFLRRQAE